MIEVRHTPIGWMWSNKDYISMYPYRTSGEALTAAWYCCGSAQPALVFPRGRS